jgi:predicted dienelactone hydrolase
VKVDAPLNIPKDLPQKRKFIPLIFSHGVGNTMSWFSTILKDLASQGFIVYSLEHNDRTALHHYSEEEKEHKYFKQLDIRDVNEIVKKLGIRVKEVGLLIDELQSITQ